MRDCFTNFITATRSTASKSGLYATDLAGVTEELLSHLRSSDESSTAEFYSRFYESTVYNFIDLISSKLSEDFYNYKVVDSNITGEFTDVDNTTSEEYAGVKIDFVDSRLSENQILRFKIYTNGAASSPLPDIYIFDDVDGTLLDTFSPDAIAAGENEYQYHGTFDTDKIYIAYKPAEITLKKTTGTTWGYNATSPRASISQINEGGIIVEYNTVCSSEKFVCSRLQALKYAFWNYIGFSIMDYRILSQNTNQSTILSQEKAEYLQDQYSQKVENSIKGILKHHRIQDDRFCFQCRGSVSIKKQLP